MSITINPLSLQPVQKEKTKIELNHYSLLMVNIDGPVLTA